MEKMWKRKKKRRRRRTTTTAPPSFSPPLSLLLLLWIRQEGLSGRNRTGLRWANSTSRVRAACLWPGFDANLTVTSRAVIPSGVFWLKIWLREDQQRFNFMRRIWPGFWTDWDGRHQYYSRWRIAETQGADEWSRMRRDKRGVRSIGWWGVGWGWVGKGYSCEHQKLRY